MLQGRAKHPQKSRGNTKEILKMTINEDLKKERMTPRELFFSLVTFFCGIIMGFMSAVFINMVYKLL